MRLWEVFGFKKSLFEETEDFWEGINKSFVYIDHLIETDPGMAALNARADLNLLEEVIPEDKAEKEFLEIMIESYEELLKRANHPISER